MKPAPARATAPVARLPELESFGREEDEYLAPRSCSFNELARRLDLASDWRKLFKVEK